MQLEINKTYKARDGSVVRITEEATRHGLAQPFGGNTGHIYTRDGLRFEGFTHSGDLVEEIKRTKE